MSTLPTRTSSALSAECSSAAASSGRRSTGSRLACANCTAFSASETASRWRSRLIRPADATLPLSSAVTSSSNRAIPLPVTPETAAHSSLGRRSALFSTSKSPHWGSTPRPAASRSLSTKKTRRSDRAARSAGSSYPHSLKRILRVPKAGSVNQRYRQAREVHLNLDHVTGGAGNLRRERHLPARKRIENVDFPTFGRADHCDFESLPKTFRSHTSSDFIS